MNPAMFDKLTYEGFGLTNYNSVLYLFDGTFNHNDILEDVLNAASSQANGYDIAKVKSAIESAGSNVKGSFLFETSIIAERPNENLIVFPLSRSAVEMVKYSEGAVTWFLYARASSTVNQTKVEDGSYSAYQILVGSIGDIGSGSDMELPGAALSNDVDYKATDISINLV